MRIAICDDQREFLVKLKRYIKRYEEEHEIGISVAAFCNGKDLLSFYRENQNIDLIILDILMEGMDGMEVARELRKFGTHTKIAFMTSTDQYAIQGYLVNACRYWTKPITYSQFSREMDWICKQIEEEENLYFCEKNGVVTKKIYFSDIVYIETFKRKTMIHTVNDQIVTTKNMKAYESILDNGEFYRCHAAYIVNMNYIRQINGLEIILKNQMSIYISKNKKKDFTKAFTRFVGRILEEHNSREYLKH